MKVWACNGAPLVGTLFSEIPSSQQCHHSGIYIIVMMALAAVPPTEHTPAAWYRVRLSVLYMKHNSLCLRLFQLGLTTA